MKTQWPKLERYKNTNATTFIDPRGNSFFFSYETLVAFWTKESGIVCRQNDWGNTTGKHLNWVQADKSKRVSSTEFEKLYNKTFNKEV